MSLGAQEYWGDCALCGNEDAKRLYERLVHEELKHKQRLELFCDDLFYGEE